MRWGMALAVLALGCRSEPPEKLLDTGWFEDSGDFDAESCPAKLVESDPYDGFGSWYWRDVPSGLVAHDAPDAYEIALHTEQGVPVTDEVGWRPDGLGFELALDGPLLPDTDYLLTVRDCAEVHEVAFSTSDLGRPLAEDPSELVDRTYHLDIQGAEWIEPGGVAGLLQIYFNTPVLLGVTLANDQLIDLMGAPGEVGPLTGMIQDTAMASWDFPVADFDDHPYFATEGATIALVVDDAVIPVEQFSFNGTFSDDMARIGGGVIQGLVDTRDMGQLLNQPNEPAAICNLAAGLGVDCIECTDGAPYCLFMHARNVRATWVQGLTLVPVE